MERSDAPACEVEKQLGLWFCGWGDHRQATLTSLAREWASKWSGFLRALAPHCKRAAAKTSAHLQIQFQTCLTRQLRGHNHHRLQWKAAIIQVGNELTVLDLVLTAQAVEPTTKSLAPVEKHDESLVPKRQRGRPATHCWQSPGSPEYTAGCPGCRHLLKCQQKRKELGFSAPSSSRDVRGDVMEEAPPPPPPAEPPPVLRTSDETDAMTLAAVHPCGSRGTPGNQQDRV